MMWPLVRGVDDRLTRHRVLQTGVPLYSGRLLARGAGVPVDRTTEESIVRALTMLAAFAAAQAVKACADLLAAGGCDIATVVAPEADPATAANPDVVKAVMSLARDADFGRALYFTRSTLYGDQPVWRHIGIYGYRRAALMARK